MPLSLTMQGSKAPSLLAAPEIRVNLAATSVGRDLGQASGAAVAS